MLSFLIQIKLSSFFKYGSLYEAQVAARQIHRRIVLTTSGLHYDCWTRARSCYPASYPSSSRSSFAVGARIGSSGWLAVNGWRASAESPWVGKAIQSRTLSGPIVDAKIVAVLRASRSCWRGPKPSCNQGPAPTDHSIAGSGGVGTASRTPPG